MSREFTIRAQEANKATDKTLIGRFLGTLPDFKGDDEWTLKPDVFKNAVSGWTMRNATTNEIQRGTLEGGLTGAKPSNYFILIKRKGDFVAVPVDQWVSFRPSSGRRGEVR